MPPRMTPARRRCIGWRWRWLASAPVLSFWSLPRGRLHSYASRPCARMWDDARTPATRADVGRQRVGGGGTSMRVMIFVDMEGIAGIETWDQVTGGKPQYEEGRHLMTGEVNAAVRGAKAAGADDIIVVDCHGAGGSYSFKSV